MHVVYLATFRTEFNETKMLHPVIYLSVDVSIDVLIDCWLPPTIYRGDRRLCLHVTSLKNSKPTPLLMQPIRMTEPRMGLHHTHIEGRFTPEER
jgi:hypothetical protein